MVAQHRREQQQKLLEDFRSSVISLKETLDLFGEAQNKASAWGYSPFPLAKRLADGTIEVTTYHIASLCNTGYTRENK